jgi:hypothetical protein
MGDSRPAVNSPAHIRRLAILSAFGVWGIGMVIGLTHGASFSQATANASVAAGGGFLAWASYHLISKGNDGLLFVAMNQAPIIHPDDGPLIYKILIFVPTFMVIGGIIGLLLRVNKSKAQESHALLHDAEIDPPLLS